MSMFRRVWGRGDSNSKRKAHAKQARPDLVRRMLRFRVEPLEERFLLSADLVAPLAGDGANTAPPVVLYSEDTTSSEDNSFLSDLGTVADVAFNSANNEILIAGDTEVDRVDAETGAILGTFDIPGSDADSLLGLQILSVSVESLGGTAVSAGSLLVTLGSASGDQILALDPVTGEQTAALDLAGAIDPAAGVFHAGRGTLFLLDSGSDEIVEVNPADGQVLARIAAPFGIGEGGLAVQPRWGTLWVSSTESGSLAELSTDGSVLQLVDLGLDSGISGLAFKGNYDLLVGTEDGDLHLIHDPFVNIATTYTGNQGDTVEVAVNIDNATGMVAMDVGGSAFGGQAGISYDTTKLTATAVRPGPVMTGFTLLPNINDTAGTIIVGAFAATPATVTSGALFFIDFLIDPSAPNGPTAINLQRVLLSDNDENALVLSPAPTAGADATDGQITIGAAGPAFSVDDVTVTEGDAGTVTATFTVTKTGAGAADVDVATANGAAVAPGDYTAVSQTLSFLSGDTTKTVAVTVNGDTVYELDETFFLNLTNATGGATISDAQGVGTITNDDAAPTLSIDDVTVAEGNTPGTVATFTVTKTGTTEVAATVQYATADVSAISPDDYIGAGLTTLTFLPGETTKTFNITVVGDAIVEPDETFQVNLSNPSNATILDGQGIGTITNDDDALSFAIDDVIVAETDAGTTTATFTVTKTGTGAADVDVASADGAAAAGIDYVAVPTTTLSFASGDTTKTVVVTVNGDVTFETDETFFINLTNATGGATISDAQGLGTITNDDTAPVFSIDDVSLVEGNSGTTAFIFTVTKTGATEITATVSAQSADDTAVAPGDYTALALTPLTFLAGESTKQVTVNVNGDTAFENNDAFFVNLSDATNATIGDAQGVGTITNDDVAPSFSIDDVTLAETDAGTTIATFTVTKTGATEVTATVSAATADGTATAGSDYVALALTQLTFLAADATKTVDVIINGDATFETDETFLVNLSGNSNATIADGQGVGTIINDDAAPTFSIDDLTLDEGNTGTTAFTFTVTKTGATEVTATVTAESADDTATAPGDYTALAPTLLTFLAGETTQTVTVNVNGDTTFEATETFFVNLSAATNATIADGQGIGTITNDDAAASLSINDVTVTEGNAGTVTASFTVTLSSASALTVTVDAATADDTAVAPGDYTAVGLTTLTFAPGVTTQTFDVLVNGDATFENDDAFFVNLSNAANATISDSQGVGTITNDDVAPSFSIDDVTLAETDAGTTIATFTVTKTGATEVTATVSAATADGTATAGSDYVALALTQLTFLAADATKTVDVIINGDVTFETDETFLVNLSGNSNATIADGQGVGTITNDDAAPTFSIDDVTLDEGNTGTTAFTFTVTKTGATEVAATVTAESADDTATAPGDYTALAPALLTFLAGETTQTVTVNVNGDTTFEATETFFVNLSAATNATIADGQGVATITNDDAAASLAINDVTVTEGNAGTVTASFTVTLSSASALTVTVDAATADDTAVAPGDYTAVGLTTLTFAPGVTTQTFDVLVNGDVTFENNDAFFVNLSNAANATISDNQGVGTITNDDAAPSFSIDDVTLAETNAGTTIATFTVTKTGATEVTATVSAATADGTATAGSDYVALALTQLTFLAADATKTVDVIINGDATFETDETFLVNLSGNSNATIADGQGVGTITNDDAAPTFSIDDVTLDEGNTGTTAFTFTVTKTGATEVTATVTAESADDTATAPGDYTALAPTLLTFLAGETTQTVTVNVNGDTTFEATETFFVNLSAATNASIADGQGIGTITNDDAAASLAINDVTVTEGNAGTVTASFTVTLSSASALTVTVDAATADDTAVAPGDYTAVGLTTLTFAPGVTTQTFDVLVNGDVTFENNDAFFVNLSNAANATISDNQGVGTITNDDAAPSFSIDDVTLAETDAGTTLATFTVTKTGATEVTATVSAATADGTATAGSDYVALALTQLTFLAADATKTVEITINGDTAYELNETFFVNLSGNSNATIADDQGVGTITNDDAAPAFSINDVTLAEGNSGTTAFSFTVTKTGATELTATVDVASSNGTATAGSDYTALTPATLTFLPGVTTQNVVVTVNGDASFELDETFFVDLSNAVNAGISDNGGTGTITNDDAAPVFSIDDVTVTEGDAGTVTATFTVTKTGATDLTASVQAATADDTAVAPDDYTAVGLTTLTFLPGETAKAFDVTVNGDNIAELDETFFVNLSNPSNATIGDAQGVGTITNDDQGQTFVISDVTLAEGDAGTTAFIFTVTLQDPEGTGATVTAQTADGTATAGSDYAAAGPTVLTFDTVTTTQTFTVLVNGDATFELNETFFVNLSGAVGAVIADSQSVGTINNDDAAPAFTIDDVVVTEGNSGTTDAVFTVTKTGDTEVAANVDVQTANGTAIAPGDFTALATTLTFAPGETTKTVTVLVNGDATYETDETFTVNLSNAVNASIGDGTGQGTITNDDAAPALSINDVTVAEGNAGTTDAVFTITKTGATELDVTVSVQTADGTATAGSDYTALGPVLVTFTPGETTQTVTVLVLGDAVYEAVLNETFLVDLSGATNATFADAQGQGTITNDDALPVFTINDVTVTEGNGGTVDAVFTVTKTGLTELTATVDATTADGTAATPGDYAAAGPTTLTFAPGVTTQQFTVQVNGDTTYELNETFSVNLSNVTNATIGDGSGAGTITNDDAAPVLSIDDVTVIEGNAGTVNAVFTVSKVGDTEVDATVNVQTVNGTAASLFDFTGLNTTLTLAPGEATKLVTVLVSGDVTFETDETFTVTLSNPANATIGDGTGLGTITNDDTAPTFSIGDVTQAEGDAGLTTFTFTVTKTGFSEVTATVSAATADGTALAGEDYVALALTPLTFLEGVTTQTVSVSVNGDTTFESDETFFVNLSGATNATILDGQATGTITNDDAPASLSINDVTVTEGNGGTVTATFTVTLSSATAFTTTVDVATANGTAATPGDYTATPTTLTFAPGVTTQTFDVTVNGDTTFETNETFFVNLTNPANASIADAQGVGTITNDDAAPTFSIDDVTLAEGNAGGTTFTFTITKSGDTEVTATVSAATADETTTAGTDYVVLPVTPVTFLANETTQTISVTVNGDTTYENDETFFVNLTGATNGTIADGEGVGTITNDDAAPVFTINDVTVTEGDGGITNATFTITKTGATELDASVDAATADGTATVAGNDFNALAQPVTFLPGDTTRNVTVQVIGDVVKEANETFFVNLSNAAGATIADPQGQGTIFNDDAPPVFTIGDVTVIEGNSGTVDAVFTVTKTGATELTATVDVQAADDSATTADNDYTAPALTTLTFLPGVTTQTFTVQVTGDTTFEPDETFFVNLTNPFEATIGDAQGVGTITNDDGPPVFSIDDVTVAEGNSGTVDATFTVSRTSAVLTASVDVQTANGTASEPGDYTAASTTLNFAAGELSKTFTVTVNGDATFEINETFNVNLSNASGATIGDGVGLGTITNDDAAPTLSINDVAVTEGNGGTANAVFTITKTGLTELTASVDVQTANGGAVAPADYAALPVTAITFAPGETVKTVTVQVNGDAIFELDEDFFVNLTTATNASVTDGQGVGTITNDDAPPAFTINDVTVTEGNAGTVNAIFTVTKTGPTELTATVNVETADATAVSPGDFAALPSAQLIFAAGEATKNVVLTVNGDTTFETNETFTVNLSNSTNATLGDAQGIGTITNDDAAPVIAIDNVTVTEGDFGPVPATFTVTLTGATEVPVAFQIQTADGTATAPGDYAALALTTLNFAVGETTKSVAITVNGDTTPENNETFFVNLSNATGATIGDSLGIGTITNDDGVIFNIADVTQAEGNGPAATAFTFLVTMTGATSLTPTVTVQTSNGTASAPGEYAAVGPTILSFAPGTTQQAVVVMVVADLIYEPNETFFVNLTDPTDGAIGVGQATGTITNDDALPAFSINDVAVAEGNSGATTATFVVTKAGATDFNATVQVQTANQTATAGADYVAVPLTTLTFLPGETTKNVAVTVNGDGSFETNETFVVNLTNPIDATITDNQGLGTIANDDAAPAFSINDVTVTEGNSGTSTATFTVTKSAASTLLNATVDVQTANGTATAGSDYVALPTTTLTFLPGETTKTVNVTITGDTLFEANETFFVSLTNPTNATISDNQGIGTINNDDSSNTAPVAVNDTATTALHTAVVINVLANDTDDKGVIATTVAVAGAPTAGTVAVDATTGQITYTPGFGFFGTDQFTYTVQDLEGLVSNAATVTVTVNRGDPSGIVITVLPDPNNPGEDSLVIVGNDNNSKIRVIRSGDEIKVMSNMGVLGTFDLTGNVVIFGNDGDDKIQVGKNVDVPVIINGGAGDDTISGGAGSAVLLGGDGDDRLTGGKGRNILIGGPGEDILKGGKVDDILIGGTTTWDSNLTALSSLQDIWSLTGVPYSQRINTIVNSPYPLTDITVFDDGLMDILTSTAGNDWFFFGTDDRVKIGNRLLSPSRLGSNFGTTIVPGTLIKLS